MISKHRQDSVLGKYIVCEQGSSWPQQPTKPSATGCKANQDVMADAISRGLLSNALCHAARTCAAPFLCVVISTYAVVEPMMSIFGTFL